MNITNQILLTIANEIPGYISNLRLVKLEDKIDIGNKNKLNESTIKDIVDKFLEDLMERMIVVIGLNELNNKNLIHYESENDKVIRFCKNFRIEFLYEINLNSKETNKVRSRTLETYIPSKRIKDFEGTSLNLHSIEVQTMFGDEKNLLHSKFRFKKTLQDWALNNLILDLHNLDKTYKRAVNNIRRNVNQILEEKKETYYH